LSTLQIVLYSLLAGLVLVFLGGAIAALIATKLQKPFVERSSGDVALGAFALALPTAVAAVTNDMRILVAGGLGAVVMIVILVATSPRCASCGERFSPLTNRQFRHPRCLFCGAPETR
jgi:Na+-translocating ferredoxin:NAD+ oxidoreductase RnfD subunit